MLSTPRYAFLLVIVAAALILAIGCGKPGKKASFQSGYFDLEHFMDKQVVYLANTKATTAKEVYLNGSTEQKNIPALDSAKWRTELEPLFDADINKPAYIKRYSVDTIRQGDTLKCIDYKALDDKLRTRQLKVYFKGYATQPDRIEAWLKSDKIFYHSTEYVSYSQGNQYQVHGKQDVVLSKPDTFAVQGIILAN